MSTPPPGMENIGLNNVQQWYNDLARFNITTFDSRYMSTPPPGFEYKLYDYLSPKIEPTPFQNYRDPFKPQTPIEIMPSYQQQLQLQQSLQPSYIPDISTDYSFRDITLRMQPPTLMEKMFTQQQMLGIQQNLNLRIPVMDTLYIGGVPVYTPPPVYNPPLMINDYSFNNYRDPFEPQIPINIDVQPMHIYEPPVYIPPTPKY